MPAAPRSAPTARLARLLGAAVDELRLGHLVVRRDLSAAFFPALIFAVAARLANGGALVPGALALVGCNTLPLAIGEVPARALCAIVFLLLPLALHVALVADGGVTPIELLFDATVAAFCAAIAHRVWTRRTPRDDDRTYRLLPRLYCAELAFAALLIV